MGRYFPARLITGCAVISALMYMQSASGGSLPICLPAPDQRLCYADYTPDDVTLVTLHAGFVVRLEFEPTENVTDLNPGIPEAYDFIKSNSALIIRIKAKAPPSNLVVNTSKRIYFIDLRQAPTVPEKDEAAHLQNSQLYRVRWRYPTDDLQNAISRQQAVAAAAIAKEKAEADLFVKAKSPAQFSFEGDLTVCPRSATTKENQTIVKFSETQDLPSIFQLDDDNTESVAPRTVVDNRTIAVHLITKRLVFRRGQFVCTVFNESLMGAKK
jgi:P-type conjugative transfer protein VirB9